MLLTLSGAYISCWYKVQLRRQQHGVCQNYTPSTRGLLKDVGEHEPLSQGITIGQAQVCHRRMAIASSAMLSMASGSDVIVATKAACP